MDKPSFKSAGLGLLGVLFLLLSFSSLMALLIGLFVGMAVEQRWFLVFIGVFASVVGITESAKAG